MPPPPATRPHALVMTVLCGSDAGPAACEATHVAACCAADCPCFCLGARLCRLCFCSDASAAEAHARWHCHARGAAAGKPACAAPPAMCWRARAFTRCCGLISAAAHASPHDGMHAACRLLSACSWHVSLTCTMASPSRCRRWRCGHRCRRPPRRAAAGHQMTMKQVGAWGVRKGKATGLRVMMKQMGAGKGVRPGSQGDATVGNASAAAMDNGCRPAGRGVAGRCSDNEACSSSGWGRMHAIAAHTRQLAHQLHVARPQALCSAAGRSWQEAASCWSEALLPAG